MRNLQTKDTIDWNLYKNVNERRGVFIQNLEESFCENGNELIEDSNHFDVDSLVCESSTVISEDFQFLNKKDNNYLHLVIRPKDIKVVNSNYETVFDDDDSNTTLDDYLIEIGCKVTSRDKIDMTL